MFSIRSFVIAALAAGVLASPVAERATCTVNSVDSAKNLSSCTDVVIEAFTVPSGQTVSIAAKAGATITMKGSVSFAKTTSAGPLLTIDTDNVKFAGNGYSFKGNGDLYWDGKGTNGGTTKPHPFLKFKGYGTFDNFIVKNSPAQAISIGTTGGAATFSKVLVDNKDGDASSLGHNTDGFDCSADDVTITNSKVYNQDDCLALNKGKNMKFTNNYCSGGHGISIGSIATDHSVSGVTISGNTVVDSMYGMRIKVQQSASNAAVSDVTYSGNTISGIDKYGFLVSQSYSEDFGTPGTKSKISGINFTGSQTTIAVNDKSVRVGVDCGNCSGTWDFSKLKVTGGKDSKIVKGGATISGGTY
ncbi:glycoside hydrolase family 28 protein [Cylindrobasidium torrendii FP15055 ss-10]|uniref:endo-polygalacturonase n=1 Tax=Cylindrobasidium torrendii FP15055 ss-10 TaxID=1314674 RepID=A0A0D7BL64_9AGAR|nr:glycoside hydrolase family 28 protein [Cylindrobasidium torrendii FP15055 ss-10]